MGEDFLKKTERTYRRSLQRTVATRLITPPLLQSDERTATTYPARLHQPGREITEQTNLLLHRRHDRKIQILDEHMIIGTVDGEPAEDLNEHFDNNPGCADILPITPVRMDGEYLDFTFKEDEDQA